MASVRKEEASTQDLPYGHFGTAEYDCNEQQWIFQRRSGHRFLLKPLGEIEPVSEPSLPRSPDDQISSTHDAPNVRRTKQLNALVGSFPELQPAVDILPRILQVSEAAEAAARTHEPLQGRLLDFGPIFTESAHVRLAHVLAFPAGSTGSDLKLQLVSRLRSGWPSNPGRDIEVLGFDGDKAIWKGPGSPIQQILFAQPQEDGRTLLAVRYLNCTKVFRPILRARPLRTTSTSRLDPSLVAEIGVHRTGGASHVDVAFNPFFTRQVAVVDGAGSWSIWELPWRHGELKCIYRGSVQDSSGPNEPKTQDPWARMHWISGPDLILLVTRYMTRLIDLSGSEPSVTHTVEHESGLLDSSVLPVDAKYLAVLTCTHFEVWDIESLSPATSLLSFRHFRSAEDPTLRMSLFKDGQDVIVLLQSNLSLASQVLHLGLEERGSIALLSDAVELSSMSLIPGKSSQVLRDIHVLRLERPFTDDVDSSTASSADTWGDTRFYSCIALSDTLAVTHLLHHTHEGVLRDELLYPIQRKTKSRPARLRASKAFVVDDDDDEADPSGSHSEVERITKNRFPGASVTHRRVTDRSDESWTIDYRINAARVQNADSSRIQTFEQIEEQTRSAMEGFHQRSNILTLADFLESELLVQDVDASTLRLEELTEHVAISQTPDVPFEAESSTSQIALRPLHPGLSDDLQQLRADQSLSSIYRSLLHDWVSPLDPTVQSGARVAKEHAIRKVAIQLALSLQTIRRETVPNTQPPAEPPSSPVLGRTSQDGPQWELPLRPPAGIYSAPSPASSGLPVYPLTPTTTSSMITSSSMQTMSQELQRLSAYTTLTRTTPVVGSRAIGPLLSHWQIGEDPDSYDWTLSMRRATQLAEAEELENADMTERERARLRRQAERHLRRQRREAAASQQLQRSQAPSIMAQSQRSEGLGIASSQTQGYSQEGHPGLATASQVQPGKFGGRPSMGSVKKRKRKSGF